MKNTKAMKDTLQFKNFEIHETKKEDDGRLTITGYGAYFNNIDSYGDIIERGAFTKTLAERKGRIAFCYQHDIWNPIGKIEEIYEDEKGLKITVKISAAEEDIQTKVKEGILKDRSVSINIAMPSMERFSRSGFIRKHYLQAISHQLMMDLNLKPLDLSKTVGTFSGGNQQKVIIGRWLAAGTKVYLFDEPTRGIDIGTKSEIYKLIENLAQTGNVVLVVSSEMPEIIRISDRVLVMKEGKIAAELIGNDINETNIGQYAIGQEKPLAA